MRYGSSNFTHIWPIDLNYRIDLPDADIRTLFQSENWKDKQEILLHYDQVAGMLW